MESSFLFAGGIFSQTEESEYHPRYTAILQRALSLGYSIPSTECQQIQNDLMISLINSGAIDEMDRLLIFANDASSDFSRIDWVNPSNTLATLVNSPTWTSKVGYEQSGGGNSYINMQYAPATQGVKYLLNDASAGVFIKGSTTLTIAGITSVAMGILTGSVHIFLGRNGNNNSRLEARINGDGSLGLSYGVLNQWGANTMYTAVRSSSSDLLLYRQGSLYGSTNISTSTSIPTGNLFLLARNTNGSPSLYMPAGIQMSMAYAGSKLVPQSALYSAFSGYLAGLATI